MACRAEAHASARDHVSEDWLGRVDSNHRIRDPKSRALPLGHAPTMLSAISCQLSDLIKSISSVTLRADELIAESLLGMARPPQRKRRFSRWKDLRASSRLALAAAAVEPAAIALSDLGAGRASARAARGRRADGEHAEHGGTAPRHRRQERSAIGQPLLQFGQSPGAAPMTGASRSFTKGTLGKRGQRPFSGTH